MKHTIEFKLPKFLDTRIDKMSKEEKESLKKVSLVVGGTLLTLATVYLVGYNRGIKKVIENRGVYIIKSGGE